MTNPIPIEVPRLKRRLKNRDFNERVNALCTVDDAAPTELVPVIMEAMDDKVLVVQIAAMFALGRIGKNAAEAVPKLISSLQNETVDACAIKALGQIGPSASAALPALRELLQSKREVIRLYAGDAIRAIER